MKFNLITQKFLLVCGLLIIFSTGICAQQPLSDKEVDSLQRAEMVALIKKLRAEGAAKDVIILGLKDQISTYNQLNAVQEARVADLKEAITHASTVDNVSVRIESLYKEQIFDYKAENLRLRGENDKLRKSRDRRSLIFGVAGMALGRFLF